MANVRKFPDATVNSRSEKRLFELASQLSNDWYLWMNVPLNFQIDSVQGEFNREIDGVLYHPDWGILLVECKDGTISAERSNANLDEFTWKQSGRILSRSPADQIKTVFYTLHEYFVKMFSKENDHCRIRIQWATFFPEMESAEKISGQIPQSHLFLKGDATSPRIFEKKVKRTLATKEAAFGGKPYPNDKLSGENLQRLIDFFASYGEPSWPELWAMNESMRVQPTDLQKMLMKTITRNRQMRIEGVAGSGKSMLVKWEADRLEKEGKRIAVLCYNDLLAEQLEQNLNPENRRDFPIEIHSFHRFAQKYVRIAKVPGAPKKEPRDPEAKSEYFESLPAYFDQALDILRRETSRIRQSNRFFDAILIDEGQDFENGWLDTALKLLKDRENGIVRFFYDSAQTLYERNVLGNATINAMPVMVLPCGYRSTRKILDWICSETDIRIPCYDNTPLGKDVEVRFYTDPSKQAEMLEKEVERLRKKKVDPKDILVVSLHSRNHSGLKAFESEIFKWSDVNESLDSQRINIVSARRYKGLDSRVVILCDMTASRNDPGFPYSDAHLLLVAATRAREHLVVFKEQKTL